MDYRRIYVQFIEDRKSRPIPDGYTERHHIKPKSMGGTNSPDNLIRLTPEDHYFAHLLLAKVYGGTQWISVHCMASMVIPATESRRVLPSRYMVGVARRKAAEYKSETYTGRTMPLRQKVATLSNVDGRSVTGSRTELVGLTGLTIPSVSRLCNGQQARSHCGWFFNAGDAERMNSKKRLLGTNACRNVAGKNKRRVKRLECGTVYASVTEAARIHATMTGNISRSIRKGVKAAAAHWSYV